MSQTEHPLSVRAFPDVLISESPSVGIRLLRASGLITLGNVSSRVISLFVGVMSARLLTEAEFGAFGLIQSTLAMFGVAAGLSFGLAATRHVALHHTNKPDQARGVAQVVLGMGAVSTILTALVMFALAPWLAIDVLGDQSLVMPLRWATVQLVFTTGYGIVAGVLSGMERFGVTAGTAILQNAVILIGSWILIPVFRLPGTIGAHAVGSALALALGLWYIREVLVGITWRGMWKEIRREGSMLIEFCLPNVLAGAIILPASWGSYILVANQPDGYSELAFFTAADRFRLLLTFVAGFVGTALLPILSRLIAGSTLDREQGRKGLELGLIGTGILIIPLTSLLAFGGPEIMSLFGRAYEANWAVLLTVIAWGGMGAIGSNIGIALLAHGKQWFLLLQQATYGAAVLGLAYLLRKFGGAGLASAHLGAVLLLLVWSYPIVRNLGVLTLRASRILVGLSAAVCTICAISWICPTGWRLIVGGPITLLSGIASILMLTRPERTSLLYHLRSSGWRTQVAKGSR